MQTNEKQRHTGGEISILQEFMKWLLTMACNIAECGNPGSRGGRCIEARNDGRCNTLDPQGSHLKKMSMLLKRNQLYVVISLNNILMIQSRRIRKVGIPPQKEQIHERVRRRLVVVNGIELRASTFTAKARFRIMVRPNAHH